MLSKNQIKHIQSLKQKKFREEMQLFVAEGVKVVNELLTSSIEVVEVYGLSSYFSDFPDLHQQVKKQEVSAAELERISFLTTPQAVLAICKIPSRQLTNTSFKGKLSLVLDDIRDPGNLGTIIRIADWFGIENIVCSKETVDAYNPKVVQATMGSISRLALHYTDLIQFLSVQKNLQLPVYGTLLEGENVYTQDLSEEGLIIIGNESNGISELVQAYVSQKLTIPSFGKLKQGGGEAESLNAAIATSIICSEFRRRSVIR